VRNDEAEQVRRSRQAEEELAKLTTQWEKEGTADQIATFASAETRLDGRLATNETGAKSCHSTETADAPAEAAQRLAESGGGRRRYHDGSAPDKPADTEFLKKNLSDLMPIQNIQGEDHSAACRERRQ
jgi:hypothetical protein